MHVNLKITTVNDYMESLDFEEIETEEIETGYYWKKGILKIDPEEIEEISNIISLEVSIYLCRRSTGHCGINADNLVELRREMINEYNRQHKGFLYIENNDFF